MEEHCLFVLGPDVQLHMSDIYFCLEIFSKGTLWNECTRICHKFFPCDMSVHTGSDQNPSYSSLSVELFFTLIPTQVITILQGPLSVFARLFHLYILGILVEINVFVKAIFCAWQVPFFKLGNYAYLSIQAALEKAKIAHVCRHYHRFN